MRDVDAEGGGAPPGGGPLLVGADVGNSKTDVVLLRPDGTLLAAVRGSTASHQRVGMEAGTATLRDLVDAARARAGLPPAGAAGPDVAAGAEGTAGAAGADVAAGAAGAAADLAVVCAAGADFPDEIARLTDLFRAAGVARRVIVRNDTDAVLHAGAPAGWGVAVVCGAGINCLAVAPDGREARYPALGPLSGDRGGGAWLGAEALAAAVRARDGRGPRTELERLVPARFGVRRPIDVVMAMYRGRLPHRFRDLAPDVFAAAAAGDAVARSIADAQADEIVTMAAALMRRLGIVRSAPVIVLAGGVFRADDPAFHARVADGLRAVAPGATVLRLDAEPVLGAAALALAAAAADPAAGSRLADAVRGGTFVTVGDVDAAGPQPRGHAAGAGR